MIYLKNSQRSVPVNTDALQRDAERLLSYLKLSAYDLSIWITTDQTIRRFNKQFRGKDKATDILSFGGLEYANSDELFDDGLSLGDLIIAASFVARMLPELDCTLDERMRVLLIHGVVHLLGYDHETDAEWAEMQVKEQELLRILKNEIN